MGEFWALGLAVSVGCGSVWFSGTNFRCEKRVFYGDFSGSEKT